MEKRNERGYKTMAWGRPEDEPINKLQAADPEYQKLKMQSEKREHKIFMRNDTKISLKKISMEKRMTLGDTVAFLIDNYESKKEKGNKFIALTKQNQELLNTIKEQNDTTNLLLKRLLENDSK